MKYNEMFGEKVRRARIEKNITQEELGKIIGYDKQTIYKIEKGKRNINYDEVKKIALHLEKDINYFDDFDEFLYNIKEKNVKFLINRINHYKKYHKEKTIEIKDVPTFIKNSFKEPPYSSLEIYDLTYGINRTIDLRSLIEDMKIVNEYLYKKGLTEKDIYGIWKTL